MVVHDVGQVIGWKLVGSFPQDFVVQGVGLNLHLSSDEIVHLYGLAFRNLEADGPGVCSLDEFLYLVCREGKGVFQSFSALVVVDECLFVSLCFGPELGEFFCRVKGVVGIAVFHELLGILAVERLALTLAIWGVRVLFAFFRSDSICNLFVCRYVFSVAAFNNFDSLVRNYAAPGQRFQDIFFGSWNKSLRISILYSEDELSSILFCKKVIIESRPYAAHVEGAGWTWCEPYSCLSFHIVFFMLCLFWALVLNSSACLC